MEARHLFVPHASILPGVWNGDESARGERAGLSEDIPCQEFQGTARAVYHLGSDLFVVLLQEPRPHALWDVRDTHRDPFAHFAVVPARVVPRPPVGGDVIQGTAAGNEVQAGMDSRGSRGILCRRTDAPASASYLRDRLHRLSLRV